MPSDAEAAPAPRLSPSRLFIEFTKITLTGFGGVIVVARRAMVDRRRWMTDQEFAAMLAVGQMLPGPNIINLAAAFGDRHAGWKGAAAAVAGLVAAPSALAIAIAALVFGLAHDPRVQGGLAGMAAAAAGLVLATAWRLGRASLSGVMPLAVTAAIFGCVALLRLPLPLVLAVALPASLLLHGVVRLRR